MFTQSDFTLMPYFTPQDNPADFAVYAASTPEAAIKAGFIAFREVSSQAELEPMLNAIKAWTTGYVKVDLSECDIQNIEGTALQGNAHIVSLILPKTLLRIGASSTTNSPFNGWTKLESVELPASLCIMGPYLFYQCTALKTVDFSACTALRTIDSNTFNGCIKLDKVIFPPQLKTIGVYAFQNCAALVNIDLSKTQLESIGNFGFGTCKSLESVKLPATLKTIGNSAFGNATAGNVGTNLKIPDFSALTALTSIGTNAFQNCFPEKEPNPVYETLDLSSTALTTIGNYAFTACKRINKVILPATLTSIGENAFGNSNAANASANLEAVDFSRCVSLTTISANAFANTALKQVDLSQTALITNGGTVFQNCKALKTVKLPVSLAVPSSINATAFTNCSALEACLLYGPPPAFTTAFGTASAAFKMYVPTNYLPLYQLLWSAYKDKILPLSEYIEIETFEEGESY
jgi:hypothetical protein